MKLDTSSYYPKSPLDDEPEIDAAPSDGAETSSMPTEREESDTPVTVTQNAPETPPTETERFINALSTGISWVLVPLLMPVYGALLAFGLSILHYTPAGTRAAFTTIVLAINLVCPAIVVWLLKKAGLVHDVGLNNREERFIPYMVCILCLVGTASFMHFKGAPEWLVMFYFGGAAAGLCEVIINRWWKISVHCAGIAGLVALVLRLQLSDFCMPSTSTWLLITIGCAGLLGSARIWLGRHTLGQVLAGYAVGFCGVFFMLSC